MRKRRIKEVNVRILQGGKVRYVTLEAAARFLFPEKKVERCSAGLTKDLKLRLKVAKLRTGLSQAEIIRRGISLVLS